ncbi:MAG: hypothetical protein KJN93_00270, partial [Alphaproteobacteria bacterium]|nr:hypothetical protein [Alphaproteobacteria bacterium]
MTFAATVTLCASLLVAPAVAAQSTDTSERFREAMSACVLPGPGLELREERLAQVGWQPVAPSPRITAT